MERIAVLNLKGGAGKSSACLHLAGAFWQLGKGLLLVDNDPGQSSLTRGFLGPDATRALDPDETVAALYAGRVPFAESLIRPTGLPGVELVAGSKEARRYNSPEPELAEPDRQEALRDFLDEVAALGRHDYCLIDCKPDLELFSFAALVAADWLIVPTQPEDFGVQGLADVAESMDLVVSGGFNPRLRLLGYLLTRVQPRAAIHQIYERDLRSQHGPAVFDSRMPDAKGYLEALAGRQTAAQYKPKQAPAKAMVAIAGEIIARIAAARSGAAAGEDRQPGEAA